MKSALNVIVVDDEEVGICRLTDDAGYPGNVVVGE